MMTVDQVLASRRRQARSRLRGGLAAALALHLGVGVAVAVGPELGREEPPPLQFVKVRVVPAAALGTTRPPEPKPKPPEPKPEPPAPKPAPPEARPAPPEPEQPSEPERREREGSPQGSALGTSRAAVAGVDNPDFTYDYYLDRMLALIEARWQRPRTDRPIEALVRFRIGREGRVTGLELLQPSGNDAFDLAALRAVETAAPFPPLPASYRSDSLGIRLIVR